MTPEDFSVRDPIFVECLRVGGPLTREFSRPGGFVGLLRIVFEQQLSTRVALALWEKLRLRLDPITPAGLLALDDVTLRECGFSRQKIGYARGLAEAVATGHLDFDVLHTLADDQAVTALTALKGIGRWTAEIYLMAALGRPDVWPAGDLAIQIGVQRLKGLETRPSPRELIALAEPWRPHRSLAARLVWHHYVALQNRPKTP
jgi:DNA-3-methyladenine glycosylase II